MTKSWMTVKGKRLNKIKGARDMDSVAIRRRSLASLPVIPLQAPPSQLTSYSTFPCRTYTTTSHLLNFGAIRRSIYRDILQYSTNNSSASESRIENHQSPTV